MIKAIETVYKGYRFRSRLEARWAVFFDCRRVKWEYEKEGYVLSNGEFYLPDFWLPEFNAFVEIKALPPTDAEINKAKLLRDGSNYTVFLFSGEVGCPFGTWIASAHSDHAHFYDVFVHYLTHNCEGSLQEARSARFEFGESG